MDKEIKELINDSVSIKNIANKYSEDSCVHDYGMEIPQTCNEDADCNDCWINCLIKSIS